MTGKTRPELPAGLLRAYRRTTYECCGVSITIGRRSRALDALLARLGARHGGLVTAWNPRSRRLPPPVNRRRQRLLASCLRRFRIVAAHGTLGAWHEDMLLAAIDPRAIGVLARRFGQNAIVVLRTRQAPRLLFRARLRVSGGPG